MGQKIGLKGWPCSIFNASEHTGKHILTTPRTRPLRQSLLLGSVGAVFLYFVTEGLLWLERYVRDQFVSAGPISGQAAQQR
jgi:hypothetical protein